MSKVFLGKKVKRILLSLLALGVVVFSINLAFRHLGHHKINLSSGETIEIPKSEWKAMNNSFDFAFNFYRKETRSKDVFGQVVTIFDQELDMSDLEARLSHIDENAYIKDFFRAHEEGPTIKIIYDRGSYYLMSRQTYFDELIGNLDPESSEESFYAGLSLFEDEIRNTVHLLKSISR